MSKPAIAVTMGDPCGIGPEIVIKAAADPALRELCDMYLCGSRDIFRSAARQLNLAAEIPPSFWENNIAEVPCPPLPEEAIGKVQAIGGRAAYDCIKRATELALDNTNSISAVATAPINKEALRAAGIRTIGHTELFAEFTGVKDPLTMFETLGLRVFFLTRHVSLRQACDMVTEERLTDYIIRCTKALADSGIKTGTMAVAGLNPHCGEHGLFGTEEDAVRAAVKKARQSGYAVEGPISADSVFHLAKIGRYNSVLSLYHDQGHIATKTLDFERTIAVTHGLPFLRTSVDHGTAFDIAGKGIASAVSMKEAIRLAAKYASYR